MNTLISRNGFCGSVGRVTPPDDFFLYRASPGRSADLFPWVGGEGPRDFLFRRSGFKSPPSE